VLRYPTPDIPRFYAFLHDISERKRGERMLHAQHAARRRGVPGAVFSEVDSGRCGPGDFAFSEQIPEVYFR